MASFLDDDIITRDQTSILSRALQLLERSGKRTPYLLAIFLQDDEIVLVQVDFELPQPDVLLLNPPAIPTSEVWHPSAEGLGSLSSEDLHRIFLTSIKQPFWKLSETPSGDDKPFGYRLDSGGWNEFDIHLRQDWYNVNSGRLARLIQHLVCPDNLDCENLGRY
jgi:hypothetical protein